MDDLSNSKQSTSTTPNSSSPQSTLFPSQSPLYFLCPLWSISSPSEWLSSAPKSISWVAVCMTVHSDGDSLTRIQCGSNMPVHRDHFMYAPSQWETTLQCNGISHWQGAYMKWSLCPVNPKLTTFEWNVEHLRIFFSLNVYDKIDKIWLCDCKCTFTIKFIQYSHRTITALSSLPWCLNYYEPILQ